MNKVALEPHPMSATSKSILGVLLYFNIFNYPLSAAEIFERSPVGSRADVYGELDVLIELGYIFRFDGYFTTQNDPDLVSRRLAANACALRYIVKARRISQLIAYFPFVRSVMLSGSISKMYMDEKSDIDYFIITDPNRLWIARFFFVLFHKTLFLNRTRLFCYNYMIAADHLTISKQNTYTATEIVTLIPTYGAEGYEDFLKANNWTEKFFPNFPIPITDHIHEGQTRIKQFLEKVFGGKLGEKLDIYLMKHTERRWHKRQPPKMFANPEAYMHLNRYTAKGHTQDHYPRILNAYRESIINFEGRHGISLFSDATQQINF